MSLPQDQLSMFETLNIEEEWRKEWQDMPEFIIDTNEPFQTVKIHFRSREDRKNFEKLIGRKMTDQTQYVWYPENEEDTTEDTGEEITTNLPKYPVYIISKGRWESRLTSKALEKLGIPYHIMVEPQEYDNYAAVIDPSKIYTLPFSNLGQGGIPARNWVWEHSVSIGAKRHWILDDNISGFGLSKSGRRLKTNSGDFFSTCEDFTDRYSNVALSGIRYRFHHHFVKAPFLANTRIYSCILIKNDLPYRWRGRYNEDTDLSLRILKDGLCTLLFTWCYCDKMATMTVKGGNTDELYAEDGRLKMAQSLQEQHPDVVTITQKWGRWQHQVDYSPFKKNKLQRAHANTACTPTNDGLFSADSLSTPAVIRG